MNKDMKQYIKNCREVFPFFGKKEKQFFSRLKQGVLTYCDSTDLTSYEDIEKEFGTPKDIIESYIRSVSYTHLEHMGHFSPLERAFILVSHS